MLGGDPNLKGPVLAGPGSASTQTRPSVVLSRSVEADWLSNRTAIIVAEKECCSIRGDCQKPPGVDPHVRWSENREG